jgi:hypothetical protein
MLVTHNAMEILFTPGRVTMLGESDGNRLRRIYTDGRPHPDTPDPTFHGHSIGHWEGDTLVVDTVDILPQAPLAISEAPWHFGQWRLRQELWAIRIVPQSSHCSTWPPSAAVRHAVMAPITRRSTRPR